MLNLSPRFNPKGLLGWRGWGGLRRGRLWRVMEVFEGRGYGGLWREETPRQPSNLGVENLVWWRVIENYLDPP